MSANVESMFYVRTALWYGLGVEVKEAISLKDALKVALTPIRVVCQNTLNLALNTAQRSWYTKHTGDIKQRMEEAKEMLFMAEKYMERLG